MKYQLVHTLSYGDAISGEVLALDRVFKKLGIESEIYAINVHPKYKGRAKDYRNFPKDFKGEVILHYSLGSPLNALYQSLTGAKRTLIYHNLTPPQWFQGVNPRIVKDITEGLAELPKLCAITDRLLADSTFNASELQSLGFKASVLPLMFDPIRWDIQGNAGIASLLSGDDSIHVLHVGRIAPNKCIEDILKVFYFLHHHVERKSRLWLSGIDIDTELYSYSLKRLVQDFKLEGAVHFCGGMADEEIKSLYEHASVYLCMSEHEGFCLPIIEAMHFGLPVIAYASSAVPETLGDGGILIEDKSPARVAELIHRVASEPVMKSMLAQQGKKRVQHFSMDTFESNVRSIFV